MNKVTVNYKGMDEGFDYRLAEINFDEEKEMKDYERLEKVMIIKGWGLNLVTDGYASCEIENMSEYKQFVSDYKEVKKSIRLWKKFGI